jgi:multiple sugar transport system permease protein
MKNELITASVTAAESRSFAAQRPSRSRFALFSGHQGRRVRESLLAYLFLLPAFLVIGLFGLFPLVFAAYQSTLRGINRVLGTYDGLGNYVGAIGNLTYVVGFSGALLLLYMAGQMVWQARAQAEGKPFWRWMASGLLIGGSVLLWFAWLFRLLPLLLAIPDQMRARRGTLVPFETLAAQAITEPSVLVMFWSALGALIGGLLLSIYLQRISNPRDSLVPAKNFTTTFSNATTMIGLGVLIGFLTWAELQLRVGQATETGALDIWTQILLISLGFILMGASWQVWKSANNRDSTWEMALRLVGGSMLLVGAWMLIGELPTAIGSGDRMWWMSLQATFYYAMGTVPVQLIVALFLAVLLFQNIRGKDFFRVVYFLPYIAPFVGTAAVFRILFSQRPDAPINSILTSLGMDRLMWLNDPNGVFNMLSPGLTLPGWMAGPSLALVVIMIFGVWTFFGFNTVVFLAGLGNIPGEMYEAAQIDGATRWAQFRHITLPLLSPTVYFLTLYSVIGTFKAFNHIYVLRTGAALGTTDTASVLIFQMFKRDTRYGYASALAILLLLIIIVLTVVNNQVASKRVHYG